MESAGSEAYLAHCRRSVAVATASRCVGTRDVVPQSVIDQFGRDASDDCRRDDESMGQRKKANPSKRRILDLDGYVPSYLTQLGNKWARSSSHLYMRKFAVGINEWRVMTMAAIEPGLTANRMCAIVGMDKAAIGRSIQALKVKGLVDLAPNENDGRSWLVSLTSEGWAMYDRILEVALAREQELLGDLSRDELRLLISLLDRLRKNLNNMRPM